MPDFQSYPLPFWLVVLALIILGVRSWWHKEASLRLPMLMVLSTAAFWYVGDALYNDYGIYQIELDPGSLQWAWWEILIFLCSFSILAPWLHRVMNRRLLGKPSNLLSLIYYGGLKSNKFQTQLNLVCGILLVGWGLLMIVALYRTDFDFKGLFMPYLGEKADPWARGRLGVGAFDAIVTLAAFAQIGLVAAFGVITALSYRPLTFVGALLACLLTLPYYLFDRTRNVILATLLPGFLAWVFLRVRAGLLIKVALLAAGFCVVEAWMKFIIENRTGTTIAAAFFRSMTMDVDETEHLKHLGLNMFEELGFINYYLANGSYRPNWGQRYFDELVNPVPRSIWPGKPMIGIDYAIARGQALESASDDATGVGATISTGMVGQGVVNFGPFLGPVAAALLMACWAAILARQDLLAAEPGRLFLYAIGLILTFNLGRDITFLILYPFCFGYLLILAAKGFGALQAAYAKIPLGATETNSNSSTAGAGFAARK